MLSQRIPAFQCGQDCNAPRMQRKRFQDERSSKTPKSSILTENSAHSAAAPLRETASGAFTLIIASHCVITPTDFAPDVPQLPSCRAHTLKGVEVKTTVKQIRKHQKNPMFTRVYSLLLPFPLWALFPHLERCGRGAHVFLRLRLRSNDASNERLLPPRGTVPPMKHGQDARTISERRTQNIERPTQK